MASGVRVWLHLVSLDVAQMGRAYDIRARYLRESDVVSGGRMMAKSGLFFWGGSRIEDDFLIAPNTTLPSEAPFWQEVNLIPSKVWPSLRSPALGLEQRRRPGVVVGKIVIMKAAMVDDLPAYAVVVDNPA